jgi:hypothetical protein
MNIIINISLNNHNGKYIKELNKKLYTNKLFHKIKKKISA